MYDVTLARALSLLAAFLQRPLMCSSKVSLLSILMPSNFSQVVFLITDTPT